MALDPNTLKLANQAKGMLHQYRSPQQQAALEAARVAGVEGFHMPTAAPMTAPSSAYRPQGPTPGGNYGAVRDGRYVGPGGNTTKLFQGQYQKYPKASKASVRSGPNDPRTGRPAKHEGRNVIRTTEKGMYGTSEEKWLKSWYKDLAKLGIPAMTPKEFSKWSGYKVPSWSPTAKDFKSQAVKHSFKEYGNIAPGDLVSQMDTSGFTSPEALLFFINKGTGENFKSLAEANKVLQPLGSYSENRYFNALRNAAEGGMDFTALSQPGGEANLPPELRGMNVLRRFGDYGSGEGGLKDSQYGFTNAGLMAALKATVSPEKRDELQTALVKAKAKTPAWVTKAYDTLAASPLGQQMGADRLFSSIFDKMTETGITNFNLTDPSKPFFAASAGGIPTSGERYLRSLDPYEYFTQYAPYQIASAQHPENRYGGLAAMGLLGNAPVGSQPVASDPLSYLPSFQRYTAYQNLDPEVLGRNASGRQFYPNDYTDAERVWMYMRDRNKQGQPWGQESWRQHKTQPTGYFNQDQGAWQGDYWSNPNFAAYAPWLLDPATLARLQAIALG